MQSSDSATYLQVLGAIASASASSSGGDAPVTSSTTSIRSSYALALNSAADPATGAAIIYTADLTPPPPPPLPLGADPGSTLIGDPATAGMPPAPAPAPPAVATVPALLDALRSALPRGRL